MKHHRLIFTIGTLLTAASAFADVTIRWQPYAAVPLERTSLIVFAVLAALIALWFISKTRKPAAQFLLAVAMVTGVYQATSHALPGFNMSGTGSDSYPCGQVMLIHNNQPEGDLSVTGTSGSDCVFGIMTPLAPTLRNGYPDCDYTDGATSFSQVMQADDYCYVRTRVTGDS